MKQQSNEVLSDKTVISPEDYYGLIGDGSNNGLLDARQFGRLFDQMYRMT